MSKPSWTQPQCERCWLLANTIYNEDGEVTHVRRPVRFIDPPAEVCSWCGMPTIVGIYVRADPKTVLYPAMEDDDAS